MKCRIRIIYLIRRNLKVEVEREFEADVPVKELVVDMLKQIGETEERVKYWKK